MIRSWNYSQEVKVNGSSAFFLGRLIELPTLYWNWSPGIGFSRKDETRWVSINRSVKVGWLQLYLFEQNKQTRFPDVMQLSCATQCSICQRRDSYFLIKIIPIKIFPIWYVPYYMIAVTVWIKLYDVEVAHILLNTEALI